MNVHDGGRPGQRLHHQHLPRLARVPLVLHARRPEPIRWDAVHDLRHCRWSADRDRQSRIRDARGRTGSPPNGGGICRSTPRAAGRASQTRRRHRRECQRRPATCSSGIASAPSRRRIASTCCMRIGRATSGSEPTLGCSASIPMHAVSSFAACPCRSSRPTRASTVSMRCSKIEGAPSGSAAASVCGDCQTAAASSIASGTKVINTIISDGQRGIHMKYIQHQYVSPH